VNVRFWPIPACYYLELPAKSGIVCLKSWEDSLPAAINLWRSGRFGSGRGLL